MRQLKSDDNTFTGIGAAIVLLIGLCRNPEESSQPFLGAQAHRAPPTSRSWLKHRRIFAPVIFQKY